jgi:hypothetical protein
MFATAPDADGPIFFSKLDIEDHSYWRMVVPANGDEWHFTYVLTKASLDEPTGLVIPSSLQTMGWCNSPACFCSALETASDVANKLAEAPTGSLPGGAPTQRFPDQTTGLA